MSENFLVLFGQRRIGKTSLLYEVIRRGKEGPFIFIFIDLSSLGELSTTTFLNRLTREISRAIAIKPSFIPERDDNLEWFQKEFLPIVYQKLKGKKLVILLDEVEYSSTGQSSKDTIAFHVSLRQLIKEERNITFVAAIGPQFFRPPPSLGQIIKEVRTIPIRRMRNETGKQLITKLAGNFLNYTDEALEKIFELSAGHPFLIQSICQELFYLKIFEGPRTDVTIIDVNVAVEKALLSGIGGFTWLIQTLNNDEEAFLIFCARLSDQHGRFEIDHTQLNLTYINYIGYLKKIDLVEENEDGSYRFVSLMIRDWLITPILQKSEGNVKLAVNQPASQRLDYQRNFNINNSADLTLRETVKLSKSEATSKKPQKEKVAINPYIVGAPVKESAFYGREKLINIVHDTLAINTVTLIVFFGQRRIGKTSLLQNLNNHPALQDFIFIYNDAIELIDKPASEALYYFSRKIARTLDLPPLSKTRLQQDEQIFQKEFLPQVYEKLAHKRLVLLLDEFDIFERRRKTDTANLQVKSALDAIEQLINNESKLAFIVALGRGKEKLFSLNRIIRTGHWAKVSLLEEEETRRLIIEPARDQLSYLPEAETAILELTSGHPYYTQLLCYEIFNELQFQNRDQVTAADVKQATEKALVTGTGGFGWLWEGLSPAERLVASLLAEAVSESSNPIVTETQLSAAFEKHRIYRRGLELTEAPNQLINLDVIERQGPTSYRFVVEIIRRWIYKTCPVAQEREQNLFLLNDRAAAEFVKGQSANNPLEAMRHYREALAANPNHTPAQLALAETLLEQNQLDEAIEAYKVAYWLDEVKAKAGLEKVKTLQSLLQRRSTKF